jgi:transposase
MQPVATLGIDAAKHSFPLYGVDAHGKVVRKKRLARTQGLAFVAGLAPGLRGLEASGRAHYWAREFTKLGHSVQLISP